MIRLSFRQGMLLGFVVLVLLLGGAALQSWRVVEELVKQSRAGSEQAIQLTALIQELSQRTVDIERSARQYMVLDDLIFRQGFDDHLAQSLRVVDRLEKENIESLMPLLSGWRMLGEAVGSVLEAQNDRNEISHLLERLVELNDQMQLAAEDWMKGQANRLLDELESSRQTLGMMIALALLGALLVALAMAWWLIRPVQQLEKVIGRLGSNRFDQAIRVGGPADLRQLGERLDWLRQRLAKLEAEREQALRHVSHELKTPLTALKEGVALLQDEVPGPLDENQKEVVGILQHNVASLQRQIESLLTLNATAQAARSVHREHVDMRTLIAEVVQRREFHIRSRQLKLNTKLPAASVALLDREKLSVVLDNLMSNAIEFSPIAGEIQLNITRTEGLLLFDCIDQGPGVAVEDQLRIFEPFIQGQRPASVPRQGSGVGLSIVRELLTAMGGDISIQPSPRGAHFHVRLPDE